MRSVLITGAAGMLGSVFSAYLFKTGKFQVYTTGRNDIQSPFRYVKADLLESNEVDYLLAFVKPDIIVHCAANVNLTDCELNQEQAYKLHAEVTEKLASYNSGKCKFVYISTDSVFDGTRGDYAESDATAPLNYYALSKLEGEKKAASANHSSLIIRTNIYGYNDNNKGKSLFEWVYNSLSNDESISGFSDVLFNPLYTVQLAELITILINKDFKGIIHAGCQEKISKFQFALMIAEIFNFKQSLVKPGLYAEMHSLLQRPKNTTLNVSNLSNLIEKKYTVADGINQLKNDFIQQKNLYG